MPLTSLIPPENIRKFLAFWCFQGVSKEISGIKWVKKDCHTNDVSRNFWEIPIVSKITRFSVTRSPSFPSWELRGQKCLNLKLLYCWTRHLRHFPVILSSSRLLFVFFFSFILGAKKSKTQLDKSLDILICLCAKFTRPKYQRYLSTNE